MLTALTDRYLCEYEPYTVPERWDNPKEFLCHLISFSRNGSADGSLPGTAFADLMIFAKIRPINALALDMVKL
ncbi:hypothetical protein [Bradyrhizobium sp. dw_78]|uniref:hypothetical protein n=1 Tax=Bradyrhizobium sp. dw_78 TaxID=2719793 RepID=UPI001BD64B04|nr:hypothetical protein [Bradyrhizobium sp. dw_78]